MERTVFINLKKEKFFEELFYWQKGEQNLMIEIDYSLRIHKE